MATLWGTSMTCPVCTGSGVLTNIDGDVEGCHRCYGEGEIYEPPDERPIGNEKLTREELNREPDSNMSDGNPSDYGDN